MWQGKDNQLELCGVVEGGPHFVQPVSKLGGEVR